MTPERYIILALLIAVAVLSWIAFGPSDPLPETDPQIYVHQERRRVLESQVDALREALTEAQGRVDTVEVVKWRTRVKHDSVARVRLEQGDSIQGVVLKERLNFNPQTGDK
jgi:hypothetical protein